VGTEAGVVTGWACAAEAGRLPPVTGSPLAGASMACRKVPPDGARATGITG
jgi:hypothetical protein